MPKALLLCLAERLVAGGKIIADDFSAFIVIN
jgi:hypothetical protein